MVLSLVNNCAGSPDPDMRHRQHWHHHAWGSTAYPPPPDSACPTSWQRHQLRSPDAGLWPLDQHVLSECCFLPSSGPTLAPSDTPRLSQVQKFQIWHFYLQPEFVRNNLKFCHHAETIIFVHLQDIFGLQFKFKNNALPRTLNFP